MLWSEVGCGPSVCIISLEINECPYLCMLTCGLEPLFWWGWPPQLISKMFWKLIAFLMVTHFSLPLLMHCSEHRACCARHRPPLPPAGCAHPPQKKRAVSATTLPTTCPLLASFLHECSGLTLLGLYCCYMVSFQHIIHPCNMAIFAVLLECRSQAFASP